MTIDMRDLPLALGSREGGEGFAAGSAKLALSRRRVVDAWLDDDPASLAAAIDQAERDLGADLDGLAAFRSSITPLTDDFRARRQLARAGAEREEARSALAATLGRLSQSVAASDDPARRELLGREALSLIESHRAEGLLTPEDAEELANEYDTGLAREQASRLLRENPALARQLMLDKDLFPVLDPETRERYAKAAEARLAARKAPDTGAAELAAGVTARARAGAELARRVRAGEADAGDVAAAEQLGEIDAATARRLRTSIESAREAKRREAEGIARVEAAFAEGRKLDPNNADDRAALDAHYRLTRKGWEEAKLSPEDVRFAIGEYIAESGLLPSDVERKLLLYLEKGTPEQKWESAELLTVLIRRPGVELSGIPRPYREKALGIVGLADVGIDPTEAVLKYEQQNGRESDKATELQKPAERHANSQAFDGGPDDLPAGPGAAAETGAGKLAELARQPSTRWTDSATPPSMDELAEVVGSIVGDQAEASAAIQSLPPTQVAVLQAIVPLGAAATYIVLSGIDEQRRRNGEPPLFKLPDLGFGSNASGEPAQRPASGAAAGQSASDPLGGSVGKTHRVGVADGQIDPAPAEPQETLPPDIRKPPAGQASVLESGPVVNVPVAPTRDEPRDSLPPPIGVDGRPVQIRPSTGVDVALGAYLSTFADLLLREDKRASPQNVEDMKRFAALCSDYAKRAYPGLTIEHTHGSSKDGKGEYLPESTHWYTKPDGTRSFGRPDTTFAGQGPDGKLRQLLFNQVTMRMSGRMSSRELRSFEALRDLAGQLIFAFGKRKRNESDEELDKRLMDTCKAGMTAAFGPPEKSMDED